MLPFLLVVNFWFLILTVQVQVLVKASCTASNEPCEPNGGQCFDSVVLALSGNLSGAIGALDYGKYCGGKNRCRPKMVAKNLCDFEERSMCKKKKENKFSKSPKKSPKKSKGSKVDDPPCPSIPCDALDMVCQIHDTCLDTIVIEDDLCDNLPIPIPQRCACEVELVYGVAGVVQASGGAPTGLCDAAFYESEIPVAPGVSFIPVQVLGNEATLVAAASCCQVLECNNTGFADPDPVKLGTAVAFCEAVETGLRNIGVQLCQVE